MFPLSPGRVIFALSRTFNQILTMNANVNHTSLKNRGNHSTSHSTRRTKITRNCNFLEKPLLPIFYRDAILLLSDIWYIFPPLSFSLSYFLNYLEHLPPIRKSRSARKSRPGIHVINEHESPLPSLPPLLAPSSSKSWRGNIQFFPISRGKNRSLGNFIGRRHARPRHGPTSEIRYRDVIAAIHFPPPSDRTFPYSRRPRTRSFPPFPSSCSLACSARVHAAPNLAQLSSPPSLSLSLCLCYFYPGVVSFHERNGSPSFLPTLPAINDYRDTETSKVCSGKRHPFRVIFLLIRPMVTDRHAPIIYLFYEPYVSRNNFISQPWLKVTRYLRINSVPQRWDFCKMVIVDF